jgi:hypothetical protein
MLIPLVFTSPDFKMKMDSNEKKNNYKVLYFVEINNFAFDCFSIQVICKIQKNMNFKINNLKT